MKRLWILEDDKELRELMSFLAAQQGYDVLAMGCLSEAREHLKKAILPDFVISDFHLPDGFSEDWMSELIEGNPQIHIVCYSGSLTVDVEERLKKQGISCISKPERLGELLKIFEATKTGQR